MKNELKRRQIIKQLQEECAALTGLANKLKSNLEKSVQQTKAA